ncbi:MAG: ATP-binding cassette domain-containing protein [Ignavibacteria bacterium]|nr:ATP-binding cassette domain-containing protein [Ignavibacteria bacterium]MBP6509010.1 ATP-binding cassette domain-containing protein [Candidatus Kapabacteria bacterium]MBK6420057.1 ATP-binding cassette domain-containing protein [Ignavibacteria bacterium]MBK6759311.1 ATP-binding cassette domain-containing protein [Ignavibacteria bacterium]MBK7034237.1 ATP-binding cassette domain-containing protein [Ignavibacteria bacterium]
MIELRGIKKAFGSKVVLSGVDMTIPNGKTTCIIGRSGCGKSVLLKHIVGLLHADAGTVTIDGNDVSKLTKDQLFEMRRRIGYVFQAAALFDSMSVFDNVVIGLVEHGETDESMLDAEGRRVLSAVGLVPDPSTTDAETFEREYRILATKKPSDLSGGMKKRVGVARALVGQPTYIFYDEPTTGLDPVTSQQIDDLLGYVADSQNVTSVVITHDMFSVYNIADHVIMLDSGVVQFSGTVPELQASTDPVVVEFLARFVTS